MKTLLPILCCISAALALNARAEKTGEKDMEIREGIETALLDFEPTSSSDVSVSVTDGVATLKGDVDSLAVKNLASNTAATVRGVRAIVNHLGIKEVERADDTISGDLKKLFALHRPGRDEAFDYKVNDGVVTLTGTVSSFALKRLSEKMASSVTGVRDVVNLLRVQLLKQPDDEEISQHIALRLKSNPMLDDKFVKIAVNEGSVEIKGAVDSYEEKSELLAAVEASGAHTIDSEQLAVSPGLRPVMERPHEPVFLTDEEMRDALRSAYRQDARLDSSTIDIAVIDGDVTISGGVESIGAKAEAERVASDLPGRGQVYSFLYVESPEFATDDAIESAISLIFAVDSQLGDLEITPEVEDQTVTLTGMTDSVYQRRKCIELASSIAGVQRVVNKLRVDWDNDKTE